VSVKENDRHSTSLLQPTFSTATRYYANWSSSGRLQRELRLCGQAYLFIAGRKYSTSIELKAGYSYYPVRSLTQIHGMHGRGAGRDTIIGWIWRRRVRSRDESCAALPM